MKVMGIISSLLFRLLVASATFGVGLFVWALWASSFEGGIYRRLPWQGLMSLLLYSLAAFWCFTLASSGGRQKGGGDRVFTWLMLACGGLFLFGVLATAFEELTRILDRTPEIY